MANPVCPSCGRKTYSAKWQCCSAAGCKLNPLTAPFSMRDELEREMLEAEVARLKRELAAAHSEIEALRNKRNVTGNFGEKILIAKAAREAGVTLRTDPTNALRQRRYRERQKVTT